MNNNISGCQKQEWLDLHLKANMGLIVADEKDHCQVTERTFSFCAVIK